MYGYIYKTTNLVNGKIYIGKKVAKRFVNHYKGSGKLIRLAFIKYGYENFTCEMLEECSSNNELNEREKYYIRFYNSKDKSIGYNISCGGDGGNVFDTLPKERQKIITTTTSNKLKGRIWVTNEIESKVIHKKDLPYYIKNGFRVGFSKEMISNMKHKHKINYAVGNKGWFARGKSSWNKGIPCSIYKKEKISKTLTGRKRSLEAIKKSSESMKKLYKNGYVSPQKGKASWNRGKKLAWVTNGVECHQIKIEELSDYLNKGYHRGRKFIN